MEGEGRELVSDTVARRPQIERPIAIDLETLKMWHVNEVPNRAPPLTETAIEAMVGWSFFQGHLGFWSVPVSRFLCHA